MKHNCHECKWSFELDNEAVECECPDYNQDTDSIKCPHFEAFKGGRVNEAVAFLKEWSRTVAS